jgi:ATP-dependent RNA helicase DeaD
MLAEAFTTKGVHPDDLALARRLLTHDQCDRILAGLLRDHLGARPEAKETAANARRAPRPQAPRAPAPAMPPAPRPLRATDTQPIPVAPAAAPALRPRAEAPASAPAEALPGPSTVGAARPASDRADRPRTGERRDRDGRRERGDRRRDERGSHRDAVAHASGTHAGNAPPPPADARSRRSRPADLVSWQPPEEEGDDEPILGADDPPTPRRAFATGVVQPTPHVGVPRVTAEPPKPGHELPPSPPPAEGDWIEIYVNVGRREGARALDLQRVLVESGGVDKANVRRVRVRDRNAFVSVPRADVERALGALNGASIGSKTVAAEIARSSGEDVAPPRPPGEPGT